MIIKSAPISSGPFIIIYHRLALLALLLPALLIDHDGVAGQEEISRTVTTSSSSNTTIVKLRTNKLRRPEICRENLLSRKAADLPPLVVIGRLKEVYLVDPDKQQPVTISQLDINTLSLLSNAQNQRALVSISRVVRGNQDLVDTDVVVSGFNGTNATPCPNFIKPNDTWIMGLDREAELRYTIQGQNLISLNLANLDRINAIAADEPLKRRPSIDDILCEAHYCAYGRCRVKVVENVSKPDYGATLTVTNKQTECFCPDTCSPMPSPVCGSDNATYTNECHLIREGCKRQKPLFVTKELPC